MENYVNKNQKKYIYYFKYNKYMNILCYYNIPFNAKILIISTEKKIGITNYYNYELIDPLELNEKIKMYNFTNFDKKIYDLIYFLDIELNSEVNIIDLLEYTRLIISNKFDKNISNNANYWININTIRKKDENNSLINYETIIISNINDNISQDLQIFWKKQKSLPIALEDNFCGIIDNKIVIACGFDGGTWFSFSTKPNDEKLNKYERKIKKSCYYKDLNDEKSDWIKISDFPGHSRQGGRTVTIANTIYMYGGHYFQPTKNHIKNINKRKNDFQSLSDGYSLGIINGKWIWKKLPDLPESLTNFGMTSYKKYIYICCGGKSDLDSLYGYASVIYKNEKIGNKLYRLDTDNLDNGWEFISYFPGTLRYNNIMTIVNEYIYIIGGIYPRNDWRPGSNSNRFYNVVDNWKYHIITNVWENIKTDIMDGFGNWGYNTDAIVYKNRYIIILGGYGYEKIISNSGIKLNKYAFKKPLQFYDNIIIYDTYIDKYYLSPTKLFCKVNNPTYFIKNDEIYYVGGESNPYIFENEKFGRHSDVFAIGYINEITNIYSLFKSDIQYNSENSNSENKSNKSNENTKIEDNKIKNNVSTKKNNKKIKNIKKKIEAKNVILKKNNAKKKI